jgi:anti-sigma factor RsiW
MKHKEIERLIQKRLDNELEIDEKRMLDKHLAQCPDCALFSQQMLQTNDALHVLVEYFPRADFNTRLLARLGLRRRFAWTKAAFALMGSWFAVLLFLAYSPLPNQIFRHLATKVPTLIRLGREVELVVSSLSQVFTPVVKNALSTVDPIIGLVFSILFFYFLGRLLQKEAKCKA